MRHDGREVCEDRVVELEDIVIGAARLEVFDDVNAEMWREHEGVVFSDSYSGRRVRADHLVCYTARLTGG